MILLAYAALWLSGIAHAVHMRSKARLSRQLAKGAAVVSLGLVTAGLVQRGVAAGHWPLTNAYEVTLLLLWAMLSILLLIEATWPEYRGSAFVLAVALLVGTYAITRSASAQAIHPLLPVLRSVWLQVHVTTSVVGYGAFGVAAGMGLQLLLQGRAVQSGEEEGGQPPDVGTERAMERVVALGFPWLTLGILTGAFWAQLAWGRYWGWDPKETWALVTWLWYVLVLHARSLPSWRGKRLAALVVGGFALVAFTFIGVPWLVRTVRLESLHGF